MADCLCMLKQDSQGGYHLLELTAVFPVLSLQSNGRATPGACGRGGDLLLWPQMLNRRRHLGTRNKLLSGAGSEAISP